jgi:DNA repair ATPase RecN
MLRRIRVRNFQSLEDVTLDLGDLTVIVGASNSGKSALVRAIQALAFNVTSANAVQAGKKTFVIDALLDKHAVRIERGSGKSEYILATVPQPGEAKADPERFTKAGKDVPSQVEEALRLSKLNFAAQFDKPFLLDATGTEVAGILGALTNIDKIFAAQREANKRATQASSELRTRKADLEEDRAKIKALAHLQPQAAAISDATSAVEALEAAEAELQDLRQLRATAETAAAARTSAQHALDSAAPPDLSHAAKVAAALRELRADRAAAEAASSNLTKANTAALSAEQALLSAEQDLKNALRDAGTCPLCGAPTVAHEHSEEPAVAS